MGQLAQFLESGKKGSDPVISTDFLYGGEPVAGQFRWLDADDRDWDVQSQSRRQGLVSFSTSQFEALPEEGRIIQGMGERFRIVAVNNYKHQNTVKLTLVAG